VTCPRSIDAGAYVLGALIPAELDEFEDHLLTCPACQAEVEELAAPASLLGRIDPATAESLLDPAPAGAHRVDAPRVVGVVDPDDDAVTVGPGVGRHVSAPRGSRGPSRPGSHGRPAGSSGPGRGDRRSIRRTIGAALGAFGLAIALMTGWQALRTPDTPDLVAMRPVAATSPITAEVGVSGAESGSRIQMQCRYTSQGPAGPWTLELMVVPRDGGPPQKVSSWSAGRGDQFEVTTTSVLPPSEIGRVEIRKADGTVLMVHNR
jgi:hypothetical protein